MEFEAFMFTLGQALGGLLKPENQQRLTESLRGKQLNPEYVAALRDRLTVALQDAGCETHVRNV